MKRKLFGFLGACALLLLLVCGSGLIYLQQPLFGRLPEGQRLSRIEQSSNYANGRFQNQIDTPINTTDQSELSIWMETIFGQKGHPRPTSPIPVVKTDLKSLNPTEDLVVWLGHSSYFIQLAGQRILIDPVLSENAAPLPLANVAFEGTSLYTAGDFPDIDLLLISHDHYDHLDFPTLQALKPKIHRVVVGLGVGAHLEAWGYDTNLIKEADWNDAISLSASLKLDISPARHFSGRAFDKDQSLWVGYVITSPKRRLFFSGDTGYGPHFKVIGDRFGPFDWVALDMGQYDPRWANVHMNPEQAAQAAEELKAKVLMPTHVAKFSLSPHDWDDPLKRITAASVGRTYALWTPEMGQVVYLDGRAQSFSTWWEHPPATEANKE